jgi:ATP/maltotriose-dependent transcriptional regulator MalT
MLHTGVIAADRVLGLLSEAVGKPDQAEGHFNDALALCQKAGFLPEYCWCAYDLAGSLLRTDRAGKRDKAITLLGKALTVTGRLGMLPLEELILNLQASIAPSPVNHHRLTRRELQVLHLLAIGESNRQIARELVLSVRTVERHVTNIYAKIDARGRADATAYAFHEGISGSP